MVVCVAGGWGREGVTIVVIVPVGGTGVGGGAVAVGEGVPGTGTDGSTSIVIGSAGGTGITMLTGGGDGSVGMTVSIGVREGDVFVGTPCMGAGVAGGAVVVPVVAAVVQVIMDPVPRPEPYVEPPGWIPDWLGAVSVVGGACIDVVVTSIVLFLASEGVVPAGIVHPAQKRNMNNITTPTRYFIKERPGIQSSKSFCM